MKRSNNKEEKHINFYNKFILQTKKVRYFGTIKDYLLQFDKLTDNFRLTYLDYSVDCNLLDKFTSKFDKYMLEEEDVDL